MPPRVYIETSIVSYLVARPSRDAIMAHRQKATRDWWAANSARVDLYTSEFVVSEAEVGEPAMAAARINHLNRMSFLHAREDAAALAGALVVGGPLPAAAYTDAMHISLAAVHGMDYLLTWNFKHIVNANMRPAVERICRAHGFAVPILCTPFQPMGG